MCGIVVLSIMLLSKVAFLLIELLTATSQRKNVARLCVKTVEELWQSIARLQLQVTLH